MRPLALALLVLAPFQSVPSLTDGDVQKAIKAGQDRKFGDLVSDCTATAGFGQNMAAGMAGGIQPVGKFQVVVTGKAGLIATKAADAKRLYKTFGLADVTPEMRAPAVVVIVTPHNPTRSSNTYDVASPIDAVVLKSKVRADAVLHPANLELEPVEWKNLMGGTITANKAVAEFSRDAFRDMPAGEFDVVVVTQAGERRCKVGVSDRKKVIGL